MTDRGEGALIKSAELECEARSDAGFICVENGSGPYPPRDGILLPPEGTSPGLPDTQCAQQHNHRQKAVFAQCRNQRGGDASNRGATDRGTVECHAGVKGSVVPVHDAEFQLIVTRRRNRIVRLNPPSVAASSRITTPGVATKRRPRRPSRDNGCGWRNQGGSGRRHGKSRYRVAGGRRARREPQRHLSTTRIKQLSP